MTVLNSRFGNLCLLSLVILASVHLVTGEEPKDKQSFKLDYFKQTMFVTAVSTGSGVFSSEDIFILDTGTNRSSLDREIANFLGLVCSGSTTDYRQTASVHRSTCLLPQLSALGRSVSNLTVVAEDNFTAYRVAYRRHVVGIIGMDFLENSVLVIDFPERTLEFLRDRSKIRLHRPTTIQMKRVHDLPLVAIGSPAGEQFDLLFDTGEDSPADAILFKPLIQALSLQPP